MDTVLAKLQAENAVLRAQLAERDAALEVADRDVAAGSGHLRGEKG